MRAHLKLCYIHLMGKFEKNSTGFVLVKRTLRMFNSCLGHITLKSRERLDKLMVLFVIRRMGERRCLAEPGWALLLHPRPVGSPNSRLQKPCTRPADMGAKGLQDGIPAVGTRLGANSPCLYPTTRPVSFFPLHQPRWPLFY